MNEALRHTRGEGQSGEVGGLKVLEPILELGVIYITVGSLRQQLFVGERNARALSAKSTLETQHIAHNSQRVRADRA